MVGPDWAKNGSHLAFRRLRQDAGAFDSFLKSSTGSLNQQGWQPLLPPERLGALLVGRWRSGAPIMVSPASDGGGSLATGDFGFAQARIIDDSSGTIAPPGDFDGL
jgi:hypothetical protein